MTECEPVDVECRIQTALAESPFGAIRELRVQRHGSALHLHGLVSSFYHKQLAQEIVRSLAGDLDVINSVAVSSAQNPRASLPK